MPILNFPDLHNYIRLNISGYSWLHNKDENQLILQGHSNIPAIREIHNRYVFFSKSKLEQFNQLRIKVTILF